MIKADFWHLFESSAMTINHYTAFILAQKVQIKLVKITNGKQNKCMIVSKADSDVYLIPHMLIILNKLLTLE